LAVAIHDHLALKETKKMTRLDLIKKIYTERNRYPEWEPLAPTQDDIKDELSLLVIVKNGKVSK
jgi:hypothetical protein